MSAKRVSAVFLRQFFLLKRSPSRVFGLFYWSLLELFLWGVLTIYLDRVGRTDFSFVAVILGALILWSFLFRVQHGVSISFMEDVWTRNLINLFASPLSVHEYMAGLLVTSIAEAVLSLAFLTFVAWALFAYNIFQFGFILIPFIAVLFLFGWALGILATAIVLRLGPSSEILAWSIPAFLTPLSGVFYPVSALPRAVQPIAALVPTTRVFEGMRTAVLSGSFEIVTLFSSFLLSIIFLVIAYGFLLISYRAVVRRGLVTRFLTE